MKPTNKRVKVHGIPRVVQYRTAKDKSYVSLDTTGRSITTGTELFSITSGSHVYKGETSYEIRQSSPMSKPHKYNTYNGQLIHNSDKRVIEAILEEIEEPPVGQQELPLEEEVSEDLPAATNIQPKTIDLTPTWEAQVRLCLMLLEHGTDAGKVTASQELLKMGQLLDDKT